MIRLVAVAGVLVALTACLEPFGVDRHDLEGDRIAALLVSPAQAPVGEPITARAALIAGDRPWSDTAVGLEWHWLPDDEVDTLADLDPGDEADATGPAPSLVIPDTGFVRLGLVARFPSGAVERGFVDLVPGPVRPPPNVTGLVFDPSDAIESGDTRDIEALVDPPDADPMMRWMTVAGRGTFLEKDRTTTQWDAAIVVRDDGEVESDDPIADGPVTFVALAVDESGGNGLRVEERWVGPAPTGLVTTRGRWIGADVAPTGPGSWQGVLEADDAAPTGVRLTGLVPGPVAGADPWGTAALPCADPVSGPFDPDWLLLGRCLRGDVVGATVAVDVP